MAFGTGPLFFRTLLSSWDQAMSVRRGCQIGMILFALAFLAGCGRAKMGQVFGKITFQGEPVTAGSITFAPQAPEDQFEAGKSASGVPDDNGEFQLSTFRKDDGALVGPHIVSYQAPGPPETVDPVVFAQRLERYKKYGKLKMPTGHVVEVKPGKNEITLELVTR